MNAYARGQERLRREPQVWLVTGAAGFVGSHLVQRLLELDQTVLGVDNFATGYPRNLEDVLRDVGRDRARRFRFMKGDICEPAVCREACDGANFVLHQAALGSVPRSLEDPIAANRVNVEGFLNMLVAARDAGVERFVYASSSSTYGDDRALPAREEAVGAPLSPYAVTKYTNELYADVFQRSYGLASVGLRYFNVFGRRQDPNGTYAAVIPRWINGLLSGRSCDIYGDGETSRDFCYVANAVQANLLAAVMSRREDGHQVYNVACGERTTLNELFELIVTGLRVRFPALMHAEPVYRDFRPGDVRHSLADTSKISRQLGFVPTHSVRAGLHETLDWYAASAPAPIEPSVEAATVE